MDLPMSCLSSTTRNTGQGQAQHSNINASSDGSNNNNNSGNCCFGRRRSQTRLPYWPSPTTISGRGRDSEGKGGGREGKREREGKVEEEEGERQREAQSESKSKSVDDGVDYGLFSNLFSYSPPFYFLEVATAERKLCGVIAMAAEQHIANLQIGMGAAAAAAGLALDRTGPQSGCALQQFQVRDASDYA